MLKSKSAHAVQMIRYSYAAIDRVIFGVAPHHYVQYCVWIVVHLDLGWLFIASEMTIRIFVVVTAYSIGKVRSHGLGGNDVAPDPGFKYPQCRIVLTITTYTAHAPVNLEEHCRTAASGFAKSTFGSKRYPTR